MTNKDIKQLAARFMEGKTSLDEERRLAEYFRSHPNEPGMEDIAAMIALFDTGMPIEGVANVKPKAHNTRSINIPRHRWWTTAAAVAAILVAFTFCIQLLIPTQEQTIAPVVCHVHQQPTGKLPTEEPQTALSKPQEEPTAEPIAEPATKRTPRIVRKTVVTQVRPKAQSNPEPIPEMVSDSIAEAVLRQKEMKMQAIYEQQLLAQARAESALRLQAAAMQLMVEYVTRYEYEETITVW